MSTMISPQGLVLNGATSSTSRKSSAILLSIDQNTLNRLKTSAGRGETLEFVTGKSPKIRCGQLDIALDISPQSHPREVFVADSPYSTYDFRSVVAHKVIVAQDMPSTEATDFALENLQKSLAEHAQAKANNRTILRGERNTSMTDTKKPLHAFSRNKPSQLQVSSSRPQSTSSTASSSTLTSPLTQRQKAMHDVLLHLLAVTPTDEAVLAATTNISKVELLTILPKIATLQKGTWTLKDRAYKDVTVWKFKYTKSSDREAAIEGAIRAYDRLRLGKDDRLWQMLLPEKERNKGRVLSRLHSGARLHEHVINAAPQGGSTPRPAGVRKSPSTTPAANRSSNVTSKVVPVNKIFKSNPDAKTATKAKTASAAQSSSQSSKVKSSQYIHDSDEDEPVSTLSRVKPDGMTITKTVTSRTSGTDFDSKTKSAKTSSPSVRGLTGAKGVARPTASRTTSTIDTPRADSRKLTPAGRVEKHGPSSKAPTPAHKPERDPARSVTAGSKSLVPLAASSGLKRPSPAHDGSDDSRNAKRPKPLAPSTGSPLPASISGAVKRKADPIAPIDTERAHKQIRSDTSSAASAASTSSVATSNNSKTASVTTTARTSVASPRPRHDRTRSASLQSSPGQKMTWSQALDEADRFQKEVYPEYVELFKRCESDPSAGLEDKKRYLELHAQLARMKREIQAAVA